VSWVAVGSGAESWSGCLALLRAAASSPNRSSPRSADGPEIRAFQSGSRTLPGVVPEVPLAPPRARAAAGRSGRSPDALAAAARLCGRRGAAPADPGARLGPAGCPGRPAAAVLSQPPSQLCPGTATVLRFQSGKRLLLWFRDLTRVFLGLVVFQIPAVRRLTF